MDKICPICNGLRELDVKCPFCGQIMTDNGNLDNYLGPYSPYEDQEVLELNNGIDCKGPDPCIHLLTCRECAIDKKYVVGRTEF